MVVTNEKIKHLVVTNENIKHDVVTNEKIIHDVVTNKMIKNDVVTDVMIKHDVLSVKMMFKNKIMCFKNRNFCEQIMAGISVIKFKISQCTAYFNSQFSLYI